MSISGVNLWYFIIQATYVVDNPATIFFTIFMALWATFFIEFWKRQQSRIQYDWDVSDYEEIEVRPCDSCSESIPSVCPAAIRVEILQ